MTFARKRFRAVILVIRLTMTGGLLVALGLCGCRKVAPPQQASGSGASHLNLNQMAPPAPANADPQQKAMRELARQKAQEAMQQAMQRR
jgi:hypothetical protein